MKAAEYDFDLPEGMIAERPAEKRDASRLLVLHRSGKAEHRRFSDLPLFLRKGDILLLNKTKVFPARIEARKKGGGRIEVLLVRELSAGTWEILTKGRYSGPLLVSGEVIADVCQGKTLRFSRPEEATGLIWRYGTMPLPPYIRRRPDEFDRERYQTVYAEEEGSIAAPTAGLHFTTELIQELLSRSVIIRYVTLHVGTGTFRPVKADDIEEHTMDAESFEIDRQIIDDMAEAKSRGGRVIAVGTTTTRAVEGFLSGACDVSHDGATIRGTTDIFIREGYRPRAVDSLITNFHLPRSTPLMLTSVFAGRERLLHHYRCAISIGYRFFSYGDAMLVL